MSVYPPMHDHAYSCNVARTTIFDFPHYCRLQRGAYDPSIRQCRICSLSDISVRMPILHWYTVNSELACACRPPCNVQAHDLEESYLGRSPVLLCKTTARESRHQRPWLDRTSYASETRIGLIVFQPPLCGSLANVIHV